MSEHEFTYRSLRPTCRAIVTIIACISFVSGVIAGYFFITSLSEVSETVKIVWTTGSGLYALGSLLVIIGVWKRTKWLLYPYMLMLPMAIAVYTIILQWLIRSLGASVFAAVAISFIFLGGTLYMAKTLGQSRREAAA
ncbi:uncharacterized protein LOC108093664 [Drosophila ficusphila]|uniref:uncharacterized protein LOC108093664 n=1 Tax=Drosophila ficusphila TaxID=30025 RepID=UPI0007E6928E|nr:uncharacterized protein LOC108093664 [Drosophila ficusphila]